MTVQSHTKIKTMDAYLKRYGPILGRKAINALDPLHVPGRDPVPDFAEITEFNPLRTPFPPQAEVIAGTVKMLDEAGNGTIVGEMGTGKTIIGMLSVHEKAKGQPYRAMVLCPDHLLPVWEEELRETIPDVEVLRFENWKGVVKLIETGGRFEKVSKGTARTAAPKSYPVSTGVDECVEKEETVPESSGQVVRTVKRWAKPLRPTWILLGRNQAKYKPEWFGVGEERQQNGRTIKRLCTSKRIVGKVPKVDEYERPVLGRDGIRLMTSVIDTVVKCPTCAAIVRAPKGVPQTVEGIAKTQHECGGNWLEGVPRVDDHASHGKDRLPGGPEYTPRVGKVIQHRGQPYKVVACKEKLWGYNRHPYRYPPAMIIQRKLRGYFGCLIIDEVHEQKSDESAQSMAAGKLMGVSKHVLALTGTLIGGYAKHLFPLLVRMSPESIREEGFEWGKDLAWSQRYGRVDRVVTTKQDAGTVSVGRKQTSMRRARKGESKEAQYVRPGVMPNLYGNHMLGNSVFITLAEMSDELPEMFEFVEDGACDMDQDQYDEYKRIETELDKANKELLMKGSMKLLGTYLWTLLDYPDKPYGWGHDAELLKSSSQDDGSAPALLGQSFLKNFNHQFDPVTETLILTRLVAGKPETDRIPLKKDGGIYWLDVKFNDHKMKRLAYDTGASTILLPHGMANDLGIKPRSGTKIVAAQFADGSIVSATKTTIDSVKVGRFEVEDVECTILPPPRLGHTVGYYDKPRDFTPENWRGVVTPAELDSDKIRPKERKLIDLCVKEKGEGRQVWVYVQMTGKRNVQPRLKRLLENAGLRVGILTSTTVKPIERKEWIDQNGMDYDVILSNPQLVSTGLTLFAKREGGHNFPTLIFYQTGYNLFTLRQAARRAWRIGQPKECRVYYLYYKDTMQHRAMALMSRKMAAAAALDGEFSTEGLIGMSDEDNAQMALARTLKGSIDDKDMQRSWSKAAPGGKAKPKKLAQPGDEIMTLTPQPVVPDALDDFPDEVQLAALTTLDLQDEDWDDDEDFDMEPLTREQLAAMFAGATVGDEDEDFD